MFSWSFMISDVCDASQRYIIQEWCNNVQICSMICQCMFVDVLWKSNCLATSVQRIPNGFMLKNVSMCFITFQWLLDGFPMSFNIVSMRFTDIRWLSTLSNNFHSFSGNLQDYQRVFQWLFNDRAMIAHLVQWVLPIVVSYESHVLMNLRGIPMLPQLYFHDAQCPSND